MVVLFSTGMTPSWRYAVELVLIGGAVALLLLVPDTTARQVTVSVVAALAMLTWLIELALIVAVHLGRATSKYTPVSPAALVLLFALTILVTSLPHLALALVPSPENHYTALAQAEGVYSVWLRLVLMQILLLGQGGYMRYLPISFIAQIISGAVIKLAFVAKALVFVMVVRQVLSKAEAARIRVRPGPLVKWRFAIYNVVLFVVELILVVTMGNKADSNNPMPPRVIFIAVAVLANVLALLEITLSMHRLFGKRHEHPRPTLSAVWDQLVFYVHVLWAAVMTTVLFDADGSWTLLLSDDPSPFKLWWRMWFVSAVALGPGGTSLIIPRRLWIEVIFAYMTVVWYFVLVLLTNVAASMTGATASRPRDDKTEESTLWSGQ